MPLKQKSSKTRFVIAKKGRPIPGLSSPQGSNSQEEHPLVKAVTAMQTAEDLRLAGKLERAAVTCERVLKQHPEYVAAHHTMGLIQADRKLYDKALDHLHRAQMLNPQEYKTLVALSGVYLKLGSNLMAARTLEQAQQLAPGDVNILVTLGQIYYEEMEYELAIEANESALKIEPSLKTARDALAANLVRIGDLAEALQIFEHRLREGERSLNLLSNLSQMPASLVPHDVVALLEEARPYEGEAVDDSYRRDLAFTKASALDKAGRYEEAWEQLCIARRYDETDEKAKDNRRKYAKVRTTHAPLLNIARTCKIDLSTHSKNASEVPISLFIAGPSRSGKTSLERLVGSLPGVKRGFENPIVENSVRRAFQTAGFPTRPALVELLPIMSADFREFYTEELHKRAGSSKVLTNTLPVRLEDALRAVVEIPNSRFVFVKRDIDDQIIRIYMRNYRSGNFYASDLSDIRDYLSWCHEMIDTAAERLPDHLCRVIHYEEMVADPSKALAEVAELCDLKLSGDALPDIGDDSGCGEPYREYIEEAINNSG